ncbi:tautomerase family protein [Paenibacillus puerhi]|uniref:tautomerase family protein n=1 Tax=Paenibacillus puerhi TaxID=2692622 RepID=UPI00135769E0|nr:tautomerase family protein [Paenibacillus puerhi]
MPFLALETWTGITEETKRQWIRGATEIGANLLNIPPDKILVLIREFPPGNWGQAGVSGADPDFAEKSRSIVWGSEETYHDGISPVSNTAVIAIDVWNVYTQAQKNEWAAGLTALTGELLGTPADKVLILFRDLPPGHWAQTGVTGAHPAFLEASRQVAAASGRG